MPMIQGVRAATTETQQGVAWPRPQGLRLALQAEHERGEPAMVTLRTGEKLRGHITCMDFDARWLILDSAREPHRKLSFNAVRCVFLTRTATRIADAAQREPQRKLCSIVTAGGEPLDTPVLEVVARRSGLFLFVPDYGREVMRWFVPATAITKYGLKEVAGSEAEDALLQEASGPVNLPATPCRSREQLEAALLRQRGLPRRRLGDLLIEEGLITREQLSKALERQKSQRGKFLGELLIEMQAVQRDAVLGVLTRQLGVPVADLDHFQYDPNAIKCLSAEAVRRYRVMPLLVTGAGGIAVAMENPLSWQDVNELKVFTGAWIEPVLASREEIDRAIDQFYGPMPANLAVLLQDLQREAAAQHSTESVEPVSESDSILVRLVNKMLMDAFEAGASDIHIESGSTPAQPSRVRFRLDGVLRPYIEVPPNFRGALVARIKIMCELDTSERRRPQDGRIKFEDFGPARFELRVLTMPTARGMEDVVLRILAPTGAMSLDKLGLPAPIMEQLKTITERSMGLLLVCGPTGSGKTTTLHSLLAHMNTSERKIWTVEDPVEIQQEGLSQVQVNTKLGLGFGQILRSFLRGDPDVIMVGETRDAETAQTVVTAALTGHLVLSTMHTNSAAESVVRLLDLGVDPFNFSDAIHGVLAQRLVRKLCACATSSVASEEELQNLAREYTRDTGVDEHSVLDRWRASYGGADGEVRLRRPKGCGRCDQTGYKDRLGVYELLVVTPEIRRALLGRARSADLLLLAADAGMVTLIQDAIEKVLQGHLDFKQVIASCR